MAMSHARLLMGMSMPWALRARATLLESICKTLQAANRRCLWLPHLVEDVNLVEDVVFDPRYTEAMLGMDLLDMMLDNTGNLTPVPVQTLATSETCLASENHAC